MHSYVVIGQTATASPEFRLDDLPGSSGRADVLLRCVRAALLYSHGVRTDVRVYLVLRGGPAAPRVMRFDGELARFIRPDERSLALLFQKTLAAAPEALGASFVELRPGIALARGDLECVLSDMGHVAVYLLDEEGSDIRALPWPQERAAYFLGDHLGFPEADRERLAALGATAWSVGPRSLHSDDVIAIVANELDRARAATAK